MHFFAQVRAFSECVELSASAPVPDVLKSLHARARAQYANILANLPNPYFTSLFWRGGGEIRLNWRIFLFSLGHEVIFATANGQVV